MAKPELVAMRGFKYMTRRLLPGDVFEAKNAVEAMILTRVRNVAAVPLPKRKAEPSLGEFKKALLDIVTAEAEADGPAIPTVDEVLTAEAVEPAKAAPNRPKPRRKAKK